MIQGPQYNQDAYRIQAIDPDRHDDDPHGNKKKRVLHQGRAWAEAEENDLPLKPDMPKVSPPAKPRKASTGVYADKVRLERAQNLFNLLTTIEEKAAQLCFLLTDAHYDSQIQHEVELLIQTWQIGGILFRKGEFRRQAYLIERYQQISKTPLLFANDYMHGLSFYLQGHPLNYSLSEKHYSDMGKAVMAQNRRLGVHVQFDRERKSGESTMSDAQAKAFRKGIRTAHGIVGKEKVEPSDQESAQGSYPLLTLKEGKVAAAAFSKTQVQETIGVKTLTFFDATNVEKTALDDELHNAFKQLYDVFLLSGNISEAIRSITRLVRSGRVSEEALDRHVMKALIIKSLFFK